MYRKTAVFCGYNKSLLMHCVVFIQASPPGSLIVPGEVRSDINNPKEPDIWLWGGRLFTVDEPR